MHFFHKLTKAQKITFLIIVTIVIIIIIYSFFTLISRFGKISTTIQYAPYNATVTINGRVIKNKSTQYLEPGEYHITVEAEHFASYTNTITISRDYHYMVGILQPNDDAGSIYQNNHAREFTETEGLVGIALNQEGSARKNQHPRGVRVKTNTPSSIIYQSIIPSTQLPIVTIATKLRLLLASRPILSILTTPSQNSKLSKTSTLLPMKLFLKPPTLLHSMILIFTHPLHSNALNKALISPKTTQSVMGKIYLIIITLYNSISTITT